MTPLRVRFAPSPTGQLHVGNARTALFNWLLARGRGGTFILRIEDTDAERSTRASETAILEDLRWLGLTWDEGPDAGGPHAPYRQSERLELYLDAARDLLARGLAYRCFCTPDELEADRRAALAAERPPKYSGKCRAIDPAEAARRVADGEAAAIRFVVPAGRDVTFNDLVRGDVTISTDVIGDPVIVRSDGRPAYNFAVVIDDARMAITDVIRGEDHIPNTPRQILIYEALGLVPPRFAHLSLVMGPDHAPLSKRHGATSVAEFRQRGYLPEALVNYLALLGWSPGENQELMALDEMARRFDVTGVSHSAAVFDMGKLAWMNRHYMKEAGDAKLARLAAADFAAAGFLTQSSDASLEYLESIMPMVIGSVDRVSEMPERVGFLFAWNADHAAALAGTDPGGATVAAALAAELAGRVTLDREAFRAAATAVKERTGFKGRALFHPIRVILTGADSGPELDLAVPAIERGSRLGPNAGVAPILSCQARAERVAELLGAK
jgi:glutamyl-tRNA synthetase/nondiscriminating glutamyl-tRNA synthetase